MIIDCIMETMRFRMLCNHLQGWIYWGDLSTGAPSLPESCKPSGLFFAAMFKTASLAEFRQGLSEAQPLCMQSPHHINAEGVADHGMRQTISFFNSQLSISNYSKRRPSSDRSVLRPPPLLYRGGACSFICFSE